VEGVMLGSSGCLGGCFRVVGAWKLELCTFIGGCFKQNQMKKTVRNQETKDNQNPPKYNKSLSNETKRISGLPKY
jgi:hypothetical protein